MDHHASRRDLLLTSLLAAFPLIIEPTPQAGLDRVREFRAESVQVVSRAGSSAGS